MTDHPIPGSPLSADDVGLLRRGDAERLERLVEFEPNTGCWLWSGSVRKSSGYAKIRVAVNKNMDAHRFSFLLHHGPIPAGMVVRHTCDHKTCVNPDHLRIGTQQDNMREMVARGRSWRGPRSGVPLTDAEKRKIDLNPSLSAVRLSSVLGRHHTAISRYRRSAAHA